MLKDPCERPFGVSSFKNDTPAKCCLGRLQESGVPQLTHVLFLQINRKPGSHGSESLGDLRRAWSTLAALLAVAWVPRHCLPRGTKTPGARSPFCKTTLGQRITGTRLQEGDSNTGGRVLYPGSATRYWANAQARYCANHTSSPAPRFFF